MSIVGLGPGDSGLLAPMALEAIERAQVVVGYTTYLDLVPAELLSGKEVVTTTMTREVERVRTAIDHAVAGRRTVVVSSGDAGVYGMAGLAHEMLAGQGLLDRLAVEVVPGIPALCAAAALLGAPLSHDFAVVSLSDLLTPWELIERRLQAAASADFVLVLYNPRSRRRSGHLAQAMAIISGHRPGETPAGLVRNAYRPGQEVVATTVHALPCDAVDMTSIIIIGNSSTRLVSGRMITPRGYDGKYSLNR